MGWHPFKDLGNDAVLLTSLPNIRYLTGFSGSSALVLVTGRETLFITDFRYVEQAAEEVDAAAKTSVRYASSSSS